MKPNIHGRPKHNPAYATFEHLIPKSAGGIAGLENCVLSHQWCNNKRARKKWPHDPFYGNGGSPIIPMFWSYVEERKLIERMRNPHRHSVA